MITIDLTSEKVEGYATALVESLRNTVGGDWKSIECKAYPYYRAKLGLLEIEETIGVEGKRYYSGNTSGHVGKDFCSSAAIWSSAIAHSFERDVSWALYETPREAVDEALRILDELINKVSLESKEVRESLRVIKPNLAS